MIHFIFIMDRTWTYLLAFGIPYFIIVGIWSFVCKMYFHWRPFVFAPFVIENYLKSSRGTAKYIITSIFWWLFFALPFLLPIIFSVILHSIFHGLVISIAVSVVPFIFMSLLLTFQNFKHSGFKVGLSSKIIIPIIALLIIALNTSTSFLYKEKSWEAIGYLLTCPSLLVYAFCLAISRQKINNDTIKDIISNEESRDQLSNDLSSKNYENWLTGSHRMKWFCIPIVIISSFGFNFIFFALFQDNETLMTVAGSIALDVLIFIRQYFMHNQLQTMRLLFGAYVLKSVVISLGQKYWLFGHTIYFSVFGSYCFIRFLHWFFIITTCCNKHTRINSDKISDEIKEQLEKITPEGRRPSTFEAIASVLSFALTVCLACADVFVFGDNATEKLFGTTQETVLVIVLAFSVSVSLCISALICAFNNKGRMTMLMTLSNCIGFAVIIVFLLFYKGLSISYSEVSTIFLICFLLTDGFLVLVLVFGNEFKFKKGSHNVIRLWFFGTLLVLDMIALIVVPIVLNKSIIGVTFVLGLLSVYGFFGFAHYFVTPTFKWDAQINFILFCCFYSGFCCSFFGYKMTKVVIYLLVIGVVIICYGICLIWTYRKRWNFSIGPLLLSLVISGALAGIFIYFFIKTEYKMASAVAAEVFMLIFCGAIFIFAMQRSKWRFSFLSILSIVLFVIFSIFEVVLIIRSHPTPYFLYTIVSIIIAFLSLCCTLMYTLINTDTQVLVFTNYFFPARRYSQGNLYKIPFFTFSMITFIFTVWVWGLFGCVEDNTFLLPPFCINAVFYLAFFFVISSLLLLDMKCISSITYISSSTVMHAINKSMNAAGIGPHFAFTEVENRVDLEQCYNSEKLNKHVNSAVSFFISALKAQLYISSEMAFVTCKQKIILKLKHYKIDTSFLHGRDFSPLDRERIIGIYMKMFNAKSVTPPQNQNIVNITSTSGKVLKSPQWKNVEDYLNLREEIIGIMNNIKPDSGKKYVDVGFHPTKRIEEEDNRILNDVKWERGEVLFHNRDFDKVCEAGDILQGYLGDCYLVTALISICNRPGFVKNLFYKPELVKTNGVTCVCFYAMGKKINIIVDSVLPILNGKPRCIQPAKETSPWWFCLVEKAFCKVIGSYSKSTGGTPDAALYRLIGGYPITMNMESLDIREKVNSGALWEQLVSWHQRGGFLICGSPEGSNSSKRNGIIQGHAYNILNVVEYRGFQLLQLRNPWGDHEWEGDWSDESSLWEQYPSVANRCKFEKSEDGVFWISFQDFTINYASIYALLPEDSLPKYYAIIENVMSPGENDGSKPVTNCAAADNLAQYIIKVPRSQQFKLVLERTGPGIGTWVYAVKSHEPIKKILSGNKYKSEPIPLNVAVHSFEWNLDSGEWVIFVCRNRDDNPSHYILKIYGEHQFEINALVNTDNKTITSHSRKK